ncbi:DUF350 domain-containing protein [Streptomyces alkaliphilus]|uniref:DUF350 domain-containing protein n=1 Tax=Streptomyces alkaliphilus TaxID=1472722 RepID=A0A7W3TI80_9ACTN|nr:DUF350 domain-containing protein [Streptomyces alkaliphilus]MBB0247319.1 DUF350 domain-containing protein [Streptomyces alkaliphilus]MQS10362.1 DUF350 domain-containing protein [Streptomyces alkaliphilus]
MADIIESAGVVLAYGVAGFAVMALGYLALDLVTPRRLSSLIWTERNVGAAIVMSGQMIGVGLVVAAAINASEFQRGLGVGLVSTLIYGLAGVIVMTLVFALVGILTPGRMGATVLEDRDGRPHPAAWVQGAMYIATAVMLTAALS